MEYRERIIRILKKLQKKRYYLKIFFFKSHIIIFDDIMPSNLSPWRALEFDALCSHFNKVKVFTNLRAFKKYNKGLSYNENLIALEKNYPNLSSSINKIQTFNNINSRLIYFVFLMNAYEYYKIAEKNKIYFALTLYPGGGFLLNNTETNRQLKEIFSSNFFKGVIVNQFHVKDYLIKNNLCEASKIHLIFGIPINIKNENLKTYSSAKFESDLNIVFFANKYLAKGEDKGFDVFQKTASILIKKTKKVKFHVIGNFDVNDLEDLSDSKHYNFYGVLTEIEYVEILKKTNIILSPNRPFKLHPNLFDGFPLATCVEASLYDNLIIATDFFNESSKINLLDNRDFILINTDANEISDKILNINNNRKILKNITNSGKEKILDIYSNHKQIDKRRTLFETLLN